MKSTYLKTRKLEKVHVANDIVQRIRRLDPPGRFLKEDEDGTWWDIGDEKARKKVGQALREVVPDIWPQLGSGVEGGGAPAVRTLETTMIGGNGQSGNMVDCVAINDVEILGISHIHTNTLDTVDVEVYTKVGTYRGSERDESAWTLIATASVKGSGKGQRTLLPEDLFDTPVTVNAGETQAFYITLTTAQMRYSDGEELGAVYADDANLKILQGAGVVYPYRATYEPRVWNGGLIYSTTGDE